MRRRAPDICRSTCRNSVAISSPSPATKCVARPGIGALYGRAEVLERMPPWHGGGEMIVSVALDKSTFKKAPHRFEAGTPNIAGAIGLAAAMDYLEEIGRTAIFEHDSALTATRRAARRDARHARARARRRARRARRLRHEGRIRTISPRSPINRAGLARRPSLQSAADAKFGLPGTTRASFYFYNTTAEMDRMIEILRAADRFFA